MSKMSLLYNHPSNIYNHYFVDKKNQRYTVNPINVDPYTFGHHRSHDRLLHQTLRQIFHERRDLTSDQIKAFLRAPDQHFIMKLILEKEPKLVGIFPKEPMSLLCIAVLGYCQKSAELLVLLGADVNECIKKPLCNHVDEKTTILHLLITTFPSAWNEQMIGLIINHGADLQARDKNGDTPLLYAVSKGRVQVTKLMLEKGADVNVANNKGETPLHVVASVSEVEKLLPLLIEYGIDVTRRDNEGLTVLHHLAWKASSKKEVELARVLIEKGVPLDDRDSFFHYRPIHLAVYTKKKELVKLFVEHGADVNAQDLKNNESPLHHAANHQDPEILLTLLEGGANVHLKTLSKGRTALDIASSNQRMKNFKLLVSAGADMLVENSDGKTPLALVSRINMKDLSFKPMLRMLALKEVTQPGIKWKEEMMIEDDYPELWDYYQDCIAEAEKMRSASFFESCTVLELLTKFQFQIAELMRDSEFEKSFYRYDLYAFPVYMKEAIEAFERAKYYYHSMIEKEYLIDLAFCNTLPHMVVRKMARCSLKCEFCEMKGIAHAYRESAQQEQQ